MVRGSTEVQEEAQPAIAPLPLTASSIERTSDSSNKAEVHTNTLIAAARKKFTACRWYPRKIVAETRGHTFNYTELEHNVQAHHKLREIWVNIAKGDRKANRIQFSYCWWDPLAWALSQFQWSCLYNEGEDMQSRRGTSCSWLELACAVDVLTGGAVGPQGSSFYCKSEIIKHGTLELLRTLDFRKPQKENGEAGHSINGKKFIGQMVIVGLPALVDFPDCLD
jgi:hypothetical protein